jgi:hypothetical protein
MDFNSIEHHIVFGDSAAGCLKYYLSNTKKIKKSNVINISDDFSCGPLSKYETKEGESNRNNWFDQLLLKTHVDEETRKYFNDRIKIFKDSLRKIGKTEKVLVWYGNNISDFIGLKYISSILNNYDNNIYGINVSEELIDEKKFDFYNPRSLAEISPENIESLLPSCKLIDNTLWNIFQENWRAISDNNYILRILDESEITFVDENYYDSLIIKKCSFRYAVCAKIVGKVMGESEQLVGDLIIDWRIRILLEKKMIEGKGIFKTMRDFSVRRLYLNPRKKLES